MGRLFDAVSFMLAGVEINLYNGHAAVELEDMAHSYLAEHPGASLEPIAFVVGSKMDSQRLFNEIRRQAKQGRDKSELAAIFHVSLVNAIREMAAKAGVRKLCFSGGVFQNLVLNNLLESLLGNEFTLYFHRRFSCNDDSIAHGQIICDNLGATFARRNEQA